MTSKIADIPSTGYFMENREVYFVNSDAGKYHIGFEAYGASKYDYFSASLDNFSLTRRASAFAPLEITDYKSEADQNGELKATLTFQAPAVNYYGEALAADEGLSINIYQGRNATIPTYTATVKPGEKITWTDQGATHGYNYYMLTCENQYGRGETLLDTLYVGRDTPALVEDCTFRATPDNDNVTITWTCPSVGVHGGVLLPDEIKYNVYAYDIALDELQLIEGGITANTYTVEANYTGEQKVFYYAVAAENTEGEGNALASGVVLGKLYNIPFNESFAGTSFSTALWQMIPMMEQVTSWGTDNPNGSYNGCDGPQDNDGGCLYMYNGSQYEVPLGALLVSPKIHLSSEKGNELRFWTYNFKENYSTNSYVQIAVTADDQTAVAIKTIDVGGATEKGWTEHVVSLDRFRTSNFVSIIFMGITSGYMDVIYLDNISVTNANAGGIYGIEADVDQELPMFNLQGIQVDHPTIPGIYLRGSRKVIVR